jgi:hypothetical protein
VIWVESGPAAFGHPHPDFDRLFTNQERQRDKSNLSLDAQLEADEP